MSQELLILVLGLIAAVLAGYILRMLQKKPGAPLDLGGLSGELARQSRDIAAMRDLVNQVIGSVNPSRQRTLDAIEHVSQKVEGLDFRVDGLRGAVKRAQKEQVAEIVEEQVGPIAQLVREAVLFEASASIATAFDIKRYLIASRDGRLNGDLGTEVERFVDEIIDQNQARLRSLANSEADDQ